MKILKGQVKYSNDNEHLFVRTLDSLFCKNYSDREFYFKVANKIRELSDGSLSEYFSVISSKFYFNNNCDFLNFSSRLTVKERDDWFAFIGFDLAARNYSNGGLTAIKNKLDSLSKNYNCSSTKKNENLKLLKEFNARILKKAELELKDP